MSVLAEPSITVAVTGAAPLSEPSDTVIPGGSLVAVTSTVRGSSWRDTVAVLSFESVAVSLSSRWDGYSWSGATNVPAAVFS